MTEEQTKAISRVMEEYAFPEEFNYWKKDQEIIMRLDESTLIAIHTSGVVTEHKQGAQQIYSDHWYTVVILKPTKLKTEAVQMKLKQIGSNMTELDLGLVQVFFSYETPVAARLTDGTLVRTAKRYSVTTTKHINKWLNGCEALTVSQDRISFLLTYPKLARESDYDEVA